MRTEGIAYKKNAAIAELDDLKGVYSNNIISPKPAIEQVAEENEAVGGDPDAGRWLFPNTSKEEMRVIWLALAVSAGLILMFILAVKKGWLKL